MGLIIKRLKEQAGYTIIEAMTVTAVLVFVLAAAYNLLDAGYLMDQQAEDGFQAQAEGRQVLTELAKYMRPAENMNASGVPLLYAGNKGTFLDIKVDVNNDTDTEIIRVDLDRANQQIKMYIDAKDTTGAQLGKYNFEKVGQTYQNFYNYPTDPLDWDSVNVLANKIVNAPPDGTETTPWTVQTGATNPEDDYRLLTFYGNSFEIPLDTRDTSPGLGPTWVNYVRGVKIFLLSDIAPAKIPSPFGIQTNIYLRNISGG